MRKIAVIILASILMGMLSACVEIPRPMPIGGPRHNIILNAIKDSETEE